MENGKWKIDEKIMKSIVKYLREVSIVVVGVAITLFASQWVADRGEQRDVAYNLDAIKMELEENANTLQIVIDEFLKPVIAYSDYLSSRERSLLEPDSIAKYQIPVMSHVMLKVTFSRSAFEAFQNSGVMHLMKDRELLLEILNSYDHLALMEQAFIKEHEILRHYFMENDAPKLNIVGEEAELQLNDTVPLYDYYKLGIPNDILASTEDALLQLQTLVDRL